MITLQPWCGGRLRANRPKRRDQRVDERERRERTRGRRAPRGIKNEPRWEQGAHTGGAICAHAWTTPDISWSALPLGIHDNTVSWEVGMTTTGRREKRRRQREEGGERGRRGGEEKKKKRKMWIGKKKMARMSHWCRMDVSPYLFFYVTRDAAWWFRFCCTGINWCVNLLADGRWLLCWSAGHPSARAGPPLAAPQEQQ